VSRIAHTACPCSGLFWRCAKILAFPSGATRHRTGGIASAAHSRRLLSLASLGSTRTMHKDPSRRQPYQRDTISQSCVAGMQAGDSTTRITGLHLESHRSPLQFQPIAVSAFQSSARVAGSLGRQALAVKAHLTPRNSPCTAHQHLQHPSQCKLSEECDNSFSARFAAQVEPARGNFWPCCASSLLICS
jgi:hypothetical protein